MTDGLQNNRKGVESAESPRVHNTVLSVVLSTICVWNSQRLIKDMQDPEVSLEIRVEVHWDPREISGDLGKNYGPD